MSRFAPSWALSAAATDSGGDPHLEPGVHLRVLPSLAIGLPVAPLLVDRVVIKSPRRLKPATDVLWTDAAGEPLTVPFDLGPASPATAWLPADPGNPVLYAEVLVEPTPPQLDFDRWRRSPVHDVVETTAALRHPTAPRGDLRPTRLPASGVRVEAIVNGQLGPSVVATDVEAPYQLCATGMDRVQVTGAGRVLGIRVLRLDRVKTGRGRESWRRLALPVERGLRYEGLPDAPTQSEDRVRRGCPRLVGLHDDPWAPDPASCTSLGPGDELDRVITLWSKRVEEMLRTAIDDPSAQPRDLMIDPGPLQGPTTQTPGSIAVPALAGVLSAALDPSMGRYLGLVEHDEAPPGAAGSLVIYVVRGAWIDYPDPWWRVLDGLLGGPDDPADFPLPLPEVASTQREGQFLDLWTAAAVVVGATPAALTAPTVGAGVDLGWIHEAPTSARRHVSLPVASLVPAAAVALARETPGLVGLNARLPDLLGGGPDRAVPIVPAMLQELGEVPAASAPGQGEVHDRFAPASAVDYRVAQSDWFGRWSGWANGSAGPGVRPPVPVPVLEASFVDPTTPGAPGTLHVRCQQPRDQDLAAGGLRLVRLELTASVGPGGPVTTVVAAVTVATNASPAMLAAAIPVPGLGVSEKRTLTVSGRWVDTGPRTSDPSPPVAVQAVDPRAPAPLVLPDTLEYAARPDALGRCQVDLTWTAGAGVAYRVYASDETTLRQRLDTLVAVGTTGASTMLAALTTATTAPQRAGVFRAHAGLFDRTCFELLTPSVLLATSAGRRTYRHEVSGSLDVLVFYKVLPVAVLATSPQLQLGGETAFGASTLLVRGVPNSAPPPTPSLTARADPADPRTVRLTIAVPQGQTQPVTLRLRRSRVSGAEAREMPVVATVTTGTWPATMVDRGATPWDPTLRLADWSTYTWRVEVQGGPEPGSTVPGLWSQASAPASRRIVPDAPGGVTLGSATVTAGQVEVRFSSVEPLEGGPEGSYRFDVYRRTPDPTTSGPVGSYASRELRQPDGSYLLRDTTLPPSGTTYVVEVTDPLGRRGPRVVVGTVA